MSNEIQRVVVEEITTSPKTYSGLNTISILNNSVDVLNVSVNAGASSVELAAGQTMMLQASTGFVLPDVLLTGTSMKAEIIYT
jgi:hypothetical protein